MRSKKAFYNFLGSIIELIIATVTSFVVPHFIIHAYGSGVNGLVSSITQFLSYIALIESGIGAIGRASLYKPLAEKDSATLSGNVKALELFYRKISYIFLGYVAVLTVLFPLLVNNDFDWVYTALLIVILSFGTFIQYYFGITYQTVIQADQRKYVPSLLQATTLLINMILTIILVKLGLNIHAVKIGSSIAFAIRPIILYLYVRKYYKIDTAAKPRSEVLKQRWDGLAQHIAFFIHKNTDIVVLTVLVNVKEVSVYSVYMLAVSGCSKVVNVFSASLEPAFGNMIAKGEWKTLKKRVSLCSFLTIQVAIILFTTAGIVLTSFVRLYTKGVTDVNYIRPAFGIIMLIAEAFYCIRMPYQSVVYAAGHFRQTRNGAIAEAAINIILSVILVFNFGLIGVAIGTLIAMLFRTIQYIWYYHYRIMQGKKGSRESIIKLLIYSLEVGAIIGLSLVVPEASSNNYGSWFIYAIITSLICFVIVILFSLIPFNQELRDLCSFAKRLIRRK